MSNKDYICRFTHTDKSNKMRCILRAMFYQLLILFVGVSIGFITNAEYVGWKFPLLERSMNNIFFPIDFEDEGVMQWLYNQGQFKVWAFNNYPEDFKIIEEAMAAEEWYWCKYSYIDNGETKVKIDHIRIRWKPWEYYYEDEARIPWNEDDLRDYLENGSLNSRDTDRAFRLRDEYKFQEEGIPMPENSLKM
jgi:hypothetical protein